MTWSNSFPGALPTNERSALLPPVTQDRLRDMATRRLQTPCDLVDKRVLPDRYGGAGQETMVVLASVLCDIEPFNRREQIAPQGFETATLYNVYLSPSQSAPVSSRLRIPGWLPAWTASQAVQVGDKRVATGEFGNGHFYECIGAGTTGAHEPIWDTRRGASQSDGGAVWQESGDAFTLEVAQTDAQRSRDTLVIVIASLLQ